MVARRTQAQRRESTIRKLLDATAQTLLEVGYAGASTQAICTRAGVSQGGLFRHFESREALMVAVCKDVGERILQRYRERFDHIEGRDPLLGALLLLREQCRSDLNQAWYELMLAARTQPKLREALEPVTRQYFQDIEELARGLLPQLAQRLGPMFPVVLDTVVKLFDGEAFHSVILGQPEVDQQRVELLASMLAQLTDR